MRKAAGRSAGGLAWIGRAGLGAWAVEVSRQRNFQRAARGALSRQQNFQRAGHRGRVRRSLLAVLAVAGCAHCASEAQQDDGIIAIGGDITEIVYALGAGDRLVAVDTTSVFPPEALETKPNVGYMRQLSPEGVLSVGAGQVLASEGAGPPETVAVLQASSLDYVVIPDDPSPEGIVAKVRAVAAALREEAKGEALAARISSRLEQLAQARARIEGPPLRVLFVLGVRNGRAIVGGEGTSAEAVIELAGGVNAVTGVVDFRPLGDEALVALAPDAILTMRRTGANHTLDELATLAGIQNTPAARHDRMYVMEGQRLLGFGPRTPDAASELMELLYGSVLP